MSVLGQHEQTDPTRAAEVDTASQKLANAMSSALDGGRAQLCRDFAQVCDIGFTYVCGGVCCGGTQSSSYRGSSSFETVC